MLPWWNGPVGLFTVPWKINLHMQLNNCIFFAQEALKTWPNHFPKKFTRVDCVTTINSGRETAFVPLNAWDLLAVLCTKCVTRGLRAKESRVLWMAVPFSTDDNRSNNFPFFILATVIGWCSLNNRRDDFYYCYSLWLWKNSQELWYDGKWIFPQNTLQYQAPNGSKCCQKSYSKMESRIWAWKLRSRFWRSFLELPKQKWGFENIFERSKTKIQIGKLTNEAGFPTVFDPFSASFSCLGSTASRRQVTRVVRCCTGQCYSPR